jgi:hypothetical protein
MAREVANDPIPLFRRVGAATGRAECNRNAPADGTTATLYRSVDARGDAVPLFRTDSQVPFICSVHLRCLGDAVLQTSKPNPD